MPAEGFGFDLYLQDKYYMITIGWQAYNEFA